MSVKNRLQRLTGEKEDSAQGPPSRAEELSRVRERVEAIMARRPAVRPPVAGLRHRAARLEDVVCGEERITSAGPFFCSELVAKGSSHHGNRCIRDMTPLSMKLVAVLANDPALAALDYTQGLFLDTETTGLSGGTGTVAFLIGLGWFENGSFVTRQIFARDYAEEEATLVHLRELLEEKRFLITFNGKAFDINLLTTRFIMNRLPDPFAGLPHVDLIHASRRLFGHRLADRRLATLEESIIGFSREGDIPSFEIPQRYFTWLRRRDGRLMADIFEHNRYDVLSMAALACHLTDIIDPEGEKTAHHPGDLLAAGRLFISRGQCEEAFSLLGHAVDSSHRSVARDASREKSLLYKRAAQWDLAVAVWKEMVRCDAGDVFALVELAKWYEHRVRNLDMALSLTRQALAHAYADAEISRVDLEHRISRLSARLNADLPPSAV